MTGFNRIRRWPSPPAASSSSCGTATPASIRPNRACSASVSTFRWSKVGGEFQINQYTTGYQRNPRVAILVSGEFIVTWSSEQDEQSGAVMARAYATDGSPIGGEFQVNTTELGAQYQPDVALDPFGQAIVVWQSFLQDGDGPGIYGQRLDLGGTKLGPEFNVNTYTTGTQRNPHVAAAPEGDFTVVWESFGNEGDPNSEAVVAQHFAGHGRRDQVETVLNATTSGHQQLPHITANAQLGQFVAVWESAGQDGDGYGVFGRLRELPRGAPADVDAVASGGSSNLNGLLEPGERVVVRPLIATIPADPLPLTGAATLGGPPGGTYTLHDAAADYGPISAGFTGSCGGTENCYEATVAGHARPPTGTRPWTRRSRSTAVRTAGRCTSAAASPMCRRTPSIPSSRTSFTTG